MNFGSFKHGTNIPHPCAQGCGFPGTMAFGRCPTSGLFVFHPPKGVIGCDWVPHDKSLFQMGRLLLMRFRRVPVQMADEVPDSSGAAG